MKIFSQQQDASSCYVHSTFVETLGNIWDHQIYTRHSSAITDIYYAYNRNKNKSDRKKYLSKMFTKNAIHSLVMKNHLMFH